MKLRTLGLLGCLTFLVHIALLQGGCGSNGLGQRGTGGTTGGCSDWQAGAAGTECGSPVVTAVDARTGAVICDPSFTVTPVSPGAVICHPTGNPFELQAFDGAATCSFSLQSLNGIEAQVEVQVAAPGYAPTPVSIVPCPSGRNVSYLVPLAPIGDAGTVIPDASGTILENCTLDDSTADCTARGLHRYDCTPNGTIEVPPSCSLTGELITDGIVTLCCP